MHAQLRAEYEAAFDCMWDRAPWGERWPDVVDRAKSADAAYRRAADCLEALREAIAAGRALVESVGATPGAPLDDETTLEGRTLPEAILVRLFANSSALVGLDSVIAMGAALPKRMDHIMQYHMPNRLRAAYTSLRQPDALDEYVTHIAPLMADRRFKKYKPIHATLKSLFGEQVQVALPGVPPRTLEGGEWRRAYLSRMLDEYPTRRCEHGVPASSGPSDRELAILSLLIDFDAVPESAFNNGFEALVRHEQKALAMARQRHGLLSNIANQARALGVDVVRPGTAPRKRKQSKARRS